MAILRSKHWQKVAETGRRIYEAERELLTHCLTLVALVALVGSATYLDVKLQPKAAQASAVREAASAVKKVAAEASAPGQAANPTSDAPAPQPTGPALPPALQGKTENLSPEILRRFDAFRTFIFQKYGAALEIRSGYRSYEEQAQLFRTLPPGRANPPGQSNHEKGEAIDYTNYSPTFNQHLGEFGLKLPFPGKEDWHIERVDFP